MNSTNTHEIFCPEIIETHSINTLSEAFGQLKSLYQNNDDNEFEINQSEFSPIPDKSDAYSSDELQPQSENEILTPAQIEKFRSIYNNTTEENEDEEQNKMETF